MDTQQDPAGPAGRLVEAIIFRDGAEVLSALAAQIVLSVPPLGFRCQGRAEAFGAIEAVLTAFPDLAYTIRSRYVAPGEVTDEVMLTGTHQAPLLGIPPTGRAGQVLARVQLAHDGSAVTALSLWADRSGLYELFDLSAGEPGASSSVVAALRASLPLGESRLIVGQSRDPVPGLLDLPAGAVGARPPAPQRPGGRGAEVRAPVPRRIRRRRATAIGAVMVVTTAGLVTWVARGTLSSAPPVHTATIASTTPVPAPTTSAPRPTASPSHPVKIEQGVTLSGNTYDLSTDVLFGVDSAQLTARARGILSRLLVNVRQRVTSGTITVTGYTDSSGPAAHNQKLSLQRAEAVTTYLQHDLRDLPAVKFKPVGRGEDNPVAKNDNPADMARNRRVTIELPAGAVLTSSATSPAGATTSAPG